MNKAEEVVVMKYRRFGKLDFEVSVLGFGTRPMTLIKEAESIEMVHYAIDHGVNYLDINFPYNPEQHKRLISVLNRALQGVYQERTKIAVSLPLSLINSRDDFDRHLEKQLHWLKKDKIDFYIIAELNRETLSKLERLNVLHLAEAAMNDGRIGALGFSFHDDFQILRSVLDAFNVWSFCQFQYSYMDVDHHPGIAGLRYAAERGLAVVVTEPLRRGRLAKEPPESIAKLWVSAPQKRSLVEWGLLWVWNHAEVSTVVVDMNEMKQMVENVALADNADPNCLSIQEQVVVNQVREAHLKLRPIPCTACRSCMPCPIGIDVPRIFELYNDADIYRDTETARFFYNSEQHNVESCDQCGLCVNKCPRKIAIPEWLKVVHKLLAA